MSEQETSRGRVSQAITAYLRVCASGGMPKHLREQVQRSVDEAERLGYFDTPEADTYHEPADDLDGGRMHR